MTKTKPVVYVVAWEYDTGGGYKWFYRKEDADNYADDERKHEREFADEHYRSVRFEYTPKIWSDRQLVTDEIDARLPELFDGALKQEV